MSDRKVLEFPDFSKYPPEQQQLLREARRGRVPSDVYQVMNDIASGNRQIFIPPTEVAIPNSAPAGEEDVVSLTDHPMNQLAGYLIGKYGPDFGIKYWTTLVMGKKRTSPKRPRQPRK